ncbi:MAG TPA: hypothetical protein VFD91_02860 [Mariniphaga sp.]|nr:hypothetical protein [Mariniphaga sp.]
MNKNGNLHIVFDGHDGTGKSTLSQLTANYCGGIYVRPFGGQEDLNLIKASEDKDSTNVLSTLVIMPLTLLMINTAILY